MYRSSRMLVQGSMLFLFFCFFIFPLVLVSSSLASAQRICSSAILPQLPSHLKPAPHEKRLCGSCCHIAEGDDPFVNRSRHNNTSSAVAARGWPTCFWVPDWNLTFEQHLLTHSSGLYLAQGLWQLYHYYVCTILTDYLCCWCFPEPGVVSERSAVSFCHSCSCSLLRLLLHFRETIYSGP